MDLLSLYSKLWVKIELPEGNKNGAKHFRIAN
jgi:hypothetical protein